MHLQRNAMYAMFTRELRRFLPIRNHLLFPLPVQHLPIFRGPAIRDPVGLRIRRRAAWAAGKPHDYANIQTLGKKNGFAKTFAVARGMLFIWMHGISMAAQRGYL